MLCSGLLRGQDCKCQARMGSHLLSQQDSYGQRGRGSHENHQTGWDWSCHPSTHTCRRKSKSQILPQAVIREVEHSGSEEISFSNFGEVLEKTLQWTSSVSVKVNSNFKSGFALVHNLQLPGCAPKRTSFRHIFNRRHSSLKWQYLDMINTLTLKLVHSHLGTNIV